MTAIQCLAKIILCIQTFLIWGLAISLSYISLTLLLIFNKYDDLTLINSSSSLLTPLLLFIISCYLLIVGIIGLCALFTNNKWLLITYFVMLFLLLSFQIGVFILFKTKIIDNNFDDVVQNVFKKADKLYGLDNSTQVTHSIDFIQTNVKCCGINSYKDWQNTWWFNSSNKRLNETYVPQSCCANYKYETNSNNDKTIFCKAKAKSPTNLDNYYIDGCYNRTIEMINSQSKTIVTVLITFTVIQFITLIAILVQLYYEFSSTKSTNYPRYVSIDTNSDNDDDYLQMQLNV